jgi:hypothetical protein
MKGGGGNPKDSQTITIQGGDLGAGGVISTPNLTINGDLGPALQNGANLTVCSQRNLPA